MNKDVHTHIRNMLKSSYKINFVAMYESTGMKLKLKGNKN